MPKNLSGLNDRRWVNITILTHLRSFNREDFSKSKSIGQAAPSINKLRIDILLRELERHRIANIFFRVILYSHFASLCSLWYIIAIAANAWAL